MKPKGSDYACQHGKLDEVKNGAGETIAMQCAYCLKFWPWEMCENCQRTARITAIAKHGRYCSARCREDSAAKRARAKPQPESTKTITR